MESTNKANNKKRRNEEASLQGSDDVDMSDVNMDDQQQQQRKIVKVKKREHNPNSMIPEDEDGDNGVIYSEDEFEEEIIVTRKKGDEEWEDVDSNADDEEDYDEEEEADVMEDLGASAKPKPQKAGKNPKKKEIWDESKEPLQEGEELVFDNSAYQMLHRAKVEWPCLSIDIILRDRINHHQQQNNWFPQFVHSMDPKAQTKDKRGQLAHKQDKFPYTVYFCAGSQKISMLIKNENKIYAMKWSEMCKTQHDDDEVNEDDGSDDDNEKEPQMRFEFVPHKGCVNRIRSMHGTGIVATWNDENEVGIYNISNAIEAFTYYKNNLQKQTERQNSIYLVIVQIYILDIVPSTDKKKKEQKNFGGSKLASFKHNDEGYALDWSPLTYGRLASGGCNSQINLYLPVILYYSIVDQCRKKLMCFNFLPADETCSSFVKETQVGLQGHRKSVEDHVLASCSVDQTVKLWDLRATSMKSQLSFRAHDCDVNVISWNSTTKFLLASGDDKGEFRIWDLRMLKFDEKEQKNFDSITRIRWHTQAITSLQFEPGEESVLAVASADNKLTLWDFSVEVDESQQTLIVKCFHFQMLIGVEQTSQQVQNAEDDIPPQLMFLHQGQQNMKELRFHPYYREMIVTTAEDSYNIFRPNLDPEDDDFIVDESASDSGLQNDEESSYQMQIYFTKVSAYISINYYYMESKASDLTAASVPKKQTQPSNYYIGSEDEEEEEERMIKTAKKLNKQRGNKKDKKNQDAKRRKMDDE